MKREVQTSLILLSGVLVGVAIFLGAWQWHAARTHAVPRVSFESNIATAALPHVAALPSVQPLASPELVVRERTDVLLDVPFVPQAPTGNWGDPIYQDGCEEASILIAMRWVEGADISTSEALAEIKAMSDFGRERYGVYLDVSAADTARLMQDYFGYPLVELKRDVTVDSVLTELYAGHLVITPMNGRALPGNVYTAPGPPRHMVVVRGYDAATKEFITNDPGTQFGEGFRYPADAFVAAIRDYPSGHYEPITEDAKAMIVVRKG